MWLVSLRKILWTSSFFEKNKGLYQKIVESIEANEGGSHPYAISLYEEVAQVHGKLIISQLPIIMATVMWYLSTSGSSPQQLYQACAKVVSTLVRYSINSNTSMVETEEVVRMVGHPLVEIIVGTKENPSLFYFFTSNDHVSLLVGK